MDQAVSFDNGAITLEHLKDCDLKHLPFETPAEIERYWTLAAECIKSDFVIEGGTPRVDIDMEDNPTCKLPAEIIQMEQASCAGDVAAAEDVYHEWLAKPQDSERAHINHFASSFAIAMAHGHVSIASYLLRVGVPMNYRHFELAIEHKSYAFLQLYLDYGYNINESPDWATPPPLFQAFQDDALTRWLLDHDADPNAQCVLDLTPLSIAMCYAPFPTIEMLFRYGGSIEHGQLLHHAVRRVLADRVKVVNYILDMGPPINDIMYQNQPYNYSLQEDFGIGTALHGAAEHGYLDVVELLLARGADPLAKDAKGKLPIERARREGRKEIVNFLLPLSS
ncbi:hypothetical protein HO133_006540 [Letharia lupina]|uniref:Ankyrin n=1 Tax=Letharia lupina TaxID=560253 RepID=A0A8H6F7M4_9LECA|nr:uncharacterized protein HO133_006540 [Letharia lupina]KAF6217713.1 hypothetical protein HO133_006540 [Letharia lupina]